MRKALGPGKQQAMIDRLEINPLKRRLYRIASISLASLSILAGFTLASVERSAWPLLPTAILLFFADALWVRSCWSLEIGPDGIALRRRRERFLLPWSELGEFAPGNGIDRHKVEYTLQGAAPLATAYRGLAKLKLRNPHFLPDTFGMSAKDLADLLNKRKKENTQPDDPPGGNVKWEPGNGSQRSQQND
jgi:hypothetical protein